jgi:uncharacterized iron-regulated membrane protein
LTRNGYRPEWRDTRGHLGLWLIAIVFAIAFPMTGLTILVTVLLTRSSLASYRP